jgi:soluble lytic murein transglycosylase
MLRRAGNSAPDKDGHVILSSMLKRGVGVSLIAVSAAAVAATLSPELSGWLSRDGSAATAPVPSTIAQTIAQWNLLRGSDSYGFEEYARFLMDHPGWPSEGALRRNAERKADPATVSPALITSFFARFSPMTGSANARYADALAVTGHPTEALAAARLAWAAGNLPADDEAHLIGRFGSLFTTQDYDRRIERLLWDRSTTNAQRLLQWASPSRQPLYAARIAIQTQSPDAPTLIAQFQASDDRDPGFLMDHVRWLRDTGQADQAQALLSRPITLTAAPPQADKWLQLLLSFAQQAAVAGQYETAYRIALNADTALPAGISMRDQAFSVRDPYTSLVWLGAEAAMRRLNRPRDAIALYDHYASGAQSAQTQAKGWYWAGRAALLAGNSSAAQQHFASAAQFGDQFYGQLAAERIGQTSGYVREVPVEIAPTDRASFDASELVQAARYMGQKGRWQDQTLFIRAIASKAKTDVDHVLAGDLAKNLGRPDLGVLIARNLRTSGASDPIRIGFPEMQVPLPQQNQWTMIHAISRQESQFDRQALSRAGARGLMQLMPATARDTSQKIGLTFDSERLIDPGYNMMLGSAYFANLLDSFGGSYVLAIAAYNAGPGNVRKFMAANGDPRLPSVDVVDWIEAIPFGETRNYVQHVLENAVVYDRLNPVGAKIPETNRLSAYLGKSNPG